MKPPKNGPFRFKNSNSFIFSPSKTKFKNSTSMNTTLLKKPKINKSEVEKALKTNPEMQKAVQGIVKNIIAKNAKKRKEEEEENKSEITGDCSQREEQLQKEIEKKMARLKKSQGASSDDLKEVPQDLLKNPGDPKASMTMAQNMLAEFLKKLVVLLVKHIPFYFFKFCIPPGPLVFGCCPEAAFFPQQIYNVLTAFEKVDKFKTVAKGYPDWLSAIGKDNPSESFYYICAQSFLTVHESALFNICSPMSLMFLNPLNLMGLIPGDFPVCFVACLQTLAICRTGLENIGPCDSLINIETLIKAIISIPLRLRLMGAFAFQCTYIPFLIRWDLLPPWSKNVPPPSEEDNNSETDGDENFNNPNSNTEASNNSNKKNCADPGPPPEEKPLSAFEQGLLDLDPSAMNEINQIRNDPTTSTLPQADELIKKDRGAPVKRSWDYKTKVDIDADFRMGKRIMNADSNTDVISTIEGQPAYSHDMIYHILTYGKESSKEKEKDFPFHTKRMLVNE